MAIQRKAVKGSAKGCELLLSIKFYEPKTSSRRWRASTLTLAPPGPFPAISNGREHSRAAVILKEPNITVH